MAKNPQATYLDKPLDVNEAKLRLIQASEEFSFMAPIQDHPFASLGAAFLLGIGATRLTPRGATTITSVAQLLGAAAQIAPLFYTRARSSGG